MRDFPDLDARLERGDIHAVAHVHRYHDWLEPKPPGRLMQAAEGLTPLWPGLFAPPGEQSLRLASELIASEAERRDSLKPLAGLCARICPGAQSSDDNRMCMLQVTRLAGHLHNLTLLDSPLEAVISQSDFLASRRAEGTLFRMAAVHFPLLSKVGRTSDLPACLADEFTAHAAVKQ